MLPLFEIEHTRSSCDAKRLHGARATGVPAAVDARERVLDGDAVVAT